MGGPHRILSAGTHFPVRVHMYHCRSHISTHPCFTFVLLNVYCCYRKVSDPCLSVSQLRPWTVDHVQFSTTVTLGLASATISS